MDRIAGRGLVLWVVILALLGGVGYFCCIYGAQAQQWALHSGNPHVYAGGGQRLVLGRVTDRQGQPLLEMGRGRIYASDATVRAATLHWLGDRSGNIRGTAVQHYAPQVAGFDRVQGLYGYGGGGGQACMTLSASVQAAALEALGDYRGTIAVMNYQTGEILCAVTTPTFDPDAVPDLQQEAYGGVYWNRFTQAAYVPGSIFKIVTTASALEALPEVQQRSFTCTGKLVLPGGAVTCERAHGRQNLQKAMKNSCNCYFGDLSVALGAETLTAAVGQMQVLLPVTFDGITTARGHFSVAGAARVELAWAGIGQHTDLVNPCAFLRFVAAVANDGMAVAPHVMAWVQTDGKQVYASEKGTGQRILAADTAHVLQQMLRYNVEKGYGDSNFPDGMTVCAKSGTGQVDGQQRSYAMFTGFVLEEQYPLAFIACVENAGYGKQVCMPMISRVLSACKAVLEA